GALRTPSGARHQVRRPVPGHLVAEARRSDRCTRPLLFRRDASHCRRAAGAFVMAGDAAADLRGAIASIDDRAVGAEMLASVRELFPICRSITGEGLRRSLRLLQQIAPLELREVATGTRVFDWVVPREWTFRSARLIGPDGRVVLDAARSNLHL